MTITASPLCWPEGWSRTRIRTRSRFGKWNKPISIAKGTDLILDQLRMMNVPDKGIIISTNLKLRLDGYPYSNQKEPDDKGVSVWWTQDKQDKVIALDKYDRIADNLYAIGKTLEAMRGIERWGSGEILARTFTGFTALPGPDQVAESNWRDVLGYHGHDIDECKKNYRALCSLHHPDRNGDTDKLATVNIAWERAKQEIENGTE